VTLLGETTDVNPTPEDYSFDLDRALAAVVGIRSTIPADAFSAQTLGTERAGNGVLIREDGVVLTIGYLINEAETIWLSLAGGKVVPGHVTAYDHQTGFGLVQALAREKFTAIPLGRSATVRVGDDMVVGGAGGRQASISARVVAKQEFAGYWEYLLEEAIFTAPSHGNWGGTALINASGELVGVGSLQLQRAVDDKQSENINLFVPIDLLGPIYNDLITLGRRSAAPRPWLGMYAAEMGGRIVLAGFAGRGPAAKSDLKTGDVILQLGGREISTLPEMFRRLWSLGPAGVDVPMLVFRDGRTIEVHVRSADRARMARRPILH
jgi:S1-C subfamily serine protease